MIPYFPEPELRLGPVDIKAFGALFVIAVLIGGRVMLRRAHRFAIGLEDMFRFCFWMFASGMLGAHVAKMAMDNTGEFLADPTLIVRTSVGIRSLGGLAGGFLGGLLAARFRKLTFAETLLRLDIVAYALPVAWMFGRLGCALAHDHRGFLTPSWMAV